MSKTTRGRNQDRSKVAGDQNYEVQYEANKAGASNKAIKKAIKSTGNSRSKIEKKLDK